MEQHCTQVWGQKFQNGTATQVWSFVGFEDAAAVDGRIKEMLDETDPEIEAIQLDWGGLYLDTDWSIGEVGGGTWSVTVNYSSRAGGIVDPNSEAPGPEHGDSKNDVQIANNVSFSFRTVNTHIAQSFETIQSYATGNTARNWGQAIRIAKPSEPPEGCDVLAGELTFKVAARLPAALVTSKYVAGLEKLTTPRPKVNAAKFMGYEIGEVLIVGGEIGEIDSGGFRPCNFEFAVKRNQDVVQFSVDPALELKNVKGWSYVWCTYKQQTQKVGDDSRMASLPFEAYEEKVYKAGDYDSLLVHKYKVRITSPSPPPPP